MKHRNKAGFTALDIPRHPSYCDVVELLLDKGAGVEKQHSEELNLNMTRVEALIDDVGTPCRLGGGSSEGNLASVTSLIH